jgi:iron(III) transport system substrate-binding protein
MRHPSLLKALSALACMTLCSVALAQQGVANAICSTDQAWCDLAASDYQKATGQKVLQVRKPTGEALAQLRAEAANPKTDIWWGGTGDPFLQAAEVGLLEAYRPSYINDLHAWSVRQYAMTGNRVGGFYTSAIAKSRLHTLRLAARRTPSWQDSCSSWGRRQLLTI